MTEHEAVLLEETGRAMRELASTVTGAPPLRLAPRPGAHAHRRAARRWQRWAVPLAAAAAVIAIAVSLVTLRDIPNGRVVPPTRPVPTVEGVPAYYAALVKAGDAQTGPEQIVVGQTITGKRVSTLAPPAGTTFTGITGAGDDRTFVVDTQPGSLDTESEPWQPRTWYLLRITPGSAHPARLTPLPVPGTAQGTNVAAIALSPDGTQLAVAMQPDGLNDPSAPFYLRVYSVASGAVLHSWYSGANREANGAAQLFDGPKYDGPDSNLALAWVGRRGLAFGYARVIPGKTIDGSQVTARKVTLAQIRFISLQAKNGGDLITAGTVLASLAPGPRVAPAPLACGLESLGSVLVTDQRATPDRPTLVCGATGTDRRVVPDPKTLCASQPAFSLGLVDYPAGARAPSRVLARYTSRCAGPMLLLEPLWSNSTGTAQLGLLGLRQGGSGAAVQFGIFTKETFKPLPMPATGGNGVIGPDPLNYIAW